MIAGVEKSTTAEAILGLVRKLKEKYKDEPKALEALKEVETEAENLKKEGDAGY
ncbi:MAG TPA: hypothetical protein PK295_03320 [Candidatus Magasanikbacteria bacterium]|nr:hypothetical protein [Candidatus Magasanikbacteria bacterium]